MGRFRSRQHPARYQPRHPGPARRGLAPAGRSWGKRSCIGRNPASTGTIACPGPSSMATAGAGRPASRSTFVDRSPTPAHAPRPRPRRPRSRGRRRARVGRKCRRSVRHCLPRHWLPAASDRRLPRRQENDDPARIRGGLVSRVQTFSKAYPQTIEKWMGEGVGYSNEKVMQNGINEACGQAR